MRPIAAFILSLAMAGMAAAQGLARADICPDGRCPTVGVPGSWSGTGQYAPADLRVDARPIARIVNTYGTARNMGTGTLVDVDGRQGLVVTCAHLFRDGAGSITVTFPGGRSYSARLLRMDAAVDLAALAIGAPEIQPVELARDYPRRGDPLVSCGYGSDGQLWCNRGQALGYVTTVGSRGRETLELSGAARFGDSGGPVLDRDGRMVAVLFGTNGRVVDGTFCGRIRLFLQGLSPRFRNRQPRMPPAPTGPLVNVPPRPAGPPVAGGPLPSGLDPIGGTPGRLEKIARPWLAAKLVGLLVSFGVPGGIAGVAGGAIVWMVMRRGKKKLHAELNRLRILRGEPAKSSTGEAETVVERHHNQYVPYEASTLDKAWAAAHARVGERYPGAVPYLKIVEGVKDQLLSGNDEPQVI